MIQGNAPAAPGDSGGPMLNSAGASHRRHHRRLQHGAASDGQQDAAAAGAAARRRLSTPRRSTSRGPGSARSSHDPDRASPPPPGKAGVRYETSTSPNGGRFISKNSGRSINVSVASKTSTAALPLGTAVRDRSEYGPALYMQDRCTNVGPEAQRLPSHATCARPHSSSDRLQRRRGDRRRTPPASLESRGRVLEHVQHESVDQTPGNTDRKTHRRARSRARPQRAPAATLSQGLDLPQKDRQQAH